MVDQEPNVFSGNWPGSLTSFEDQVSILGFIRKFMDCLPIQKLKDVCQTSLRRWNIQNKKVPNIDVSKNSKEVLH